MATEWAAQVTVRLSEEDLDILHSVLGPGERSAHCYLRLAREAATSPAPNIRLWYMQKPLFPDWMSMGPMTPEQARDRAINLERKGFKCRTEVMDNPGIIEKWKVRREEGEE